MTQPTSEPPVTPGPIAKRRPRWPLIAGGVVLLIVVIGVASQLGRSSQPAAAPTAAAQASTITATVTATATRTVTETATPVPVSSSAPVATSAAASEGGVGQTLGFTYTGGSGSGEGVVTVHSAEWRADSGGSLAIEPDNGAYLLVDVGVEVTEGSVFVSSFDWAAKDSDGRSWSCDDGLYFDPSLRTGDVKEGDKLRGYIACDVPQKDLTVVWDDELEWAVPAAG